MSLHSYPLYKKSDTDELGDVPAHWSVVALKRFSRLTYGDALPSDNRDESGSIPVFGSNGPVGVHTQANAESPVILVGRKGSCGALNWSNEPVFAIDTVYYIDGRNAHASLRWVYWALHIAGLGTASQDTGVPGLPREYAHDVRLPFPPAKEQPAIADFLDGETGKIDALVAEQEKLIELLKEKRQAVISHAVTKGLDPTAPMKDSGIECLGAVPAHWQIKRLRHLVREGTSITYGIVQAGPHVEDGIPYIKTSDMSGVTLPLEGYSRTSPEIDQAYRRSKVAKGDLVIAIRATVGKCLPVPDELDGANLTQGTAKISPGASVRADFLLHAISASTTQAYFEIMSKGATFREITLDALRRTPIPIPGQSEQADISQFVNDAIIKFDALISEVQRAIDLLKEHRSALISAAVTGKIDVRALTKTERPIRALEPV